MKLENEGNLEIQAQPISLLGVLNLFNTTPFLDPVPRLGRLQLGGQVEITQGETKKFLKVKHFNSEVKLGDRVLVGYIARGYSPVDL